MARFQRVRSVGVSSGTLRLQVGRLRYSECTKPPKASNIRNESVICAVLALAQAGRGVWYRNAAAVQSGTNLVVTLLHR
jgi:hypothetical protein